MPSRAAGAPRPGKPIIARFGKVLWHAKQYRFIFIKVPDHATFMSSRQTEAQRPRVQRKPPYWMLWPILFAAATGGAKAGTLNLAQVSPGIYVHQGHPVGLTAPERDDIANIGFVIGDQCVAVIDTGGSVTTGGQLRTALREVTTKPICYIINTHVHYDHLLGNAAFAADGAKFVGHRNLVAAVANNRSFFLQSFARELEGGSGAQRVIGPEIAVDKSMTLDLGNRRIRLTAHRTAHTDCDLSVLDLNSNTLWAADLLFVQRIPALDGSINGWIDESEKLASRNWSKVIPGHGAVPDDWKSAVAAQIRYLQTLRSEIRSVMKRGGLLEDALGTVGQGEQTHWLLFEENHKRNITRAFAELEWE
jgi:quinoprotein relay system zinc metallohydrolase 2